MSNKSCENTFKFEVLTHWGRYLTNEIRPYFSVDNPTISFVGHDGENIVTSNYFIVVRD